MELSFKNSGKLRGDRVDVINAYVATMRRLIGANDLLLALVSTRFEGETGEAFWDVLARSSEKELRLPSSTSRA